MAQTKRLQVGKIEAIIVGDNDGEPSSAAEMKAMFEHNPGVADDSIFEQLTPSELIFSYNCLLLKVEGRHILVDAGLGILPDAPDKGQLLHNLAAEGIQPADIDLVVISHFHGDHFFGCFTPDGGLTFPNARYATGEIEYNYWINRSEQPDRQAKVLALPREKITLLQPDDEIAPGVRVVAAFGHTPGHLGIWVESEGQRLVHLVDMLHATLQMPRPHYSPGFDVQPDVSPATRRAWLERAARENLLVQFYHLPFPGLGHVLAQDDAFVWQPLEG